MPWAFLLGLGIFLAAGAAALGGAGVLARRYPAERGALELAALACAGIFGVLFLFQNVLAHDALWYYAHLRSAIVDGDLDLYDEIHLHNPYAMRLPSPSAPIAALGLPILTAPAALAARPIAAFLAHRGVAPGWDGYEPLEIAAVTLTTLLAALGGMALTQRCARTVAGGPAATIAVTSLLYASPLALFAFVWPGQPVAVSVFVGAAFLCVWGRDDATDSSWRALLLGVLGGVLALIRPVDGVFLALPLLDALVQASRSRNTVRALRSCALVGLGAAVGTAPQWVAWVAAGSPPFTLPNRDAALTAWAPLYLVGALGILLLRRSHPRLCRGLLLLVVLDGLGARTLHGAWPALAIGLAVAIERLARRVGTFAAGLGTIPFVYWNLLLMAQLRLGWIALDPRAHAADALTRQITEAPAALVRGLCASSGWNQVALIEQLRAAVETGALRACLPWVAELALATGALALWMKCLTGVRLPSPRLPALLIVALSGLAACAVAAVAHDHDRTRLLAQVEAAPLLIPAGALRALPLEAPATDTPHDRAAAIAWRAELNGGDPARLRLDLVSFLRHAEDLEDGMLAARIDLHGPACPEVSFAVRAGIETAGMDPERAERTGGMRHGLTHANVVQSWREEDLSSGGSLRHAYLATWPLAPGCRPDSVLVRVERTGAELEIRRLSVALVRDGGGFAGQE